MIIEQQNAFTLKVRFEDDGGQAVRMPSYDWTVSLFADVPSHRVVVKQEGGEISLRGSHDPLAVLTMDEDECGFKVAMPMLSIGQGEVKYKVVVKSYDRQDEDAQNGDTGHLLLSRRHMRRFSPEDKTDEVTIGARGKAVRWLLAAEDGRYVVTEDGRKIDMSKTFSVK